MNQQNSTKFMSSDVEQFYEKRPIDTNNYSNIITIVIDDDDDESINLKKDHNNNESINLEKDHNDNESITSEKDHNDNESITSEKDNDNESINLEKDNNEEISNQITVEDNSTDISINKQNECSPFKQINNLNKFYDHKCSNKCLTKQDQENLDTYGVSIWLRPIIYGWKRIIDYRYDYSNYIVYLSPCGIRFTNIELIFDYLQQTKSNLAIDNFCLDSNLIVNENSDNLNVEFKIFVNDISMGIEKNQPISLINSIDSNYIDGFEYISECIFSNRIQNNPFINLDDENFLVCCDCDDNCRNSNNCACQCLTKENSRIILNKDYKSEYPLKNRLLTDKIVTGIYECNSRCACNATKHLCVNRTVQLGIRNRLQIFKTLNKGWGVRCLNDIQRGSFICCYAGVILDPEETEDQGYKFGDKYLADLDFIDYVGEHKSEKFNDCSLTYEELIEKKREILTTELNKFKILYGDFNIYTINGAMKSNVGRFLNHSCDPNCFSQSVFVDNHDLRFPRLAIFSSRFIPAFTELTWNYNYHIDYYAKRQISCYCYAENCKDRLL